MFSSYHFLTSGKLLPQEKLDSLMADHFATFVTDYDLETLKSANIDTLRIPVSYNMFLPEVNRTDSFPKGERRALDVYVSRHIVLTSVSLNVLRTTTWMSGST